MHAFDFIMLFFSFIYALALAHLLLAVTFMIRYRQKIVFSAPHAVWMFDALLTVSINWVSLWDFHNAETISLGAVVGGFVLAIAQYLACALVSPEFKDERDFDLRLFQREQYRSYLSAFLVLIVVSIGANAGGSAVGIQKWASENALVLPMLPIVLVLLFVANQRAQFVGGLLFGCLNIAYVLVYYPVLR